MRPQSFAKKLQKEERKSYNVKTRAAYNNHFCCVETYQHNKVEVGLGFVPSLDLPAYYSVNVLRCRPASVLNSNVLIMTKEEYIKNTEHCVKIIRTMYDLLGLDCNVEEMQNAADTDYMIGALTLINIHISDGIDFLKEIGQQYKEDIQYDEFVKKCKNGENKLIKWNDIPNKIREKLNEIYQTYANDYSTIDKNTHDMLMQKALDEFKTKYNIISILI